MVFTLLAMVVARMRTRVVMGMRQDRVVVVRRHEHMNGQIAHLKREAQGQGYGHKPLRMKWHAHVRGNFPDSGRLSS